MTPIQYKSLSLQLENIDCFLQAKTGTGKTSNLSLKKSRFSSPQSKNYYKIKAGF